MLYDFYGDLLTPRQQEFFDIYYNEDLSLAEIAENYGISRQGVRDVIARAENIMEDMEEKTGIMKRFLTLQEHLESLSSVLDSMKERNDQALYDLPLDALIRQASDLVEQMKE